MKKTLKKGVSLVLVIAVLITSMLVSSVGAEAISPMQDVLLKALSLNFAGKTAFNAVLNAAATDIDSAAADLKVLFSELSVGDAKLALEKYNDLSDDQKALIQANVLMFDLNLKSYDGNGFDTIIDKVNTEVAGSASKDEGVSFIIQILEYLNAAGKKGAYATDVSSDTSKIKFEYNPNDTVVALAIVSFNGLIGAMETLNAKISTSSGASPFDKLLSYTAGVVNSAPVTEIAALKTYLNSLNDSYYIPYVAPSTGDPSNQTPKGNDEGSKDLTDVLEDLNKINDSNTSGVAQNDLKKAAEAAIEKEIAKVGTTTVTPSIVGNTATITADQIKLDDVISKAEAVLAKAAEIAKLTGSSDVNIEKKVTIDIASGNAEKVNVALSSELLTKVQEKGIEKVEIVSGEIKLNVAPDFIAETKGSKSVSFGINKVAVTEELKSKMSAEQKLLLSSNSMVIDFNASVIAADGTEKKITNFDKAITVKIKYSLKAGESKDKITVLYLSDDGTVKNMIGRYNEASGEVVFETSHFSSYVIKNVVKKFNDVASGSWYKNQAESLASKGIVEGRSGNNFVPNGNITRAEFVTMLVKAKGIYDQNAVADFADVSEDAWYYTYVASAVKAGITSGMGNDMFAPNSLITREQMAVMLANALGVKKLSNASEYLKFKDADKVSSYAVNASALCVKNEFIVGNNNMFDPQGKATRGMAAVVVYKFFNYIY